MSDKNSHSRFRDFLIPDVKNTLESASYRHSREDFDGAQRLLYLAKDKIDECIEQLQQDKQERQKAGEQDE
jgi:hypothetical protein